VPIPRGGEMAGLIVLHAPLARAFDARDRLSVQLLAGTIALGLAAAPAAAVGAPDPLLAAGFEAAPTGLAFVAPDGAFLAANRRFCALAGRRRDAVLRATLRDIVSADDLDDQAGLVEGLLSGTIDDFDMVTRSDAGMPLRLSVGLARNASGEPDFLIVAAEPAPPQRSGDAPYDPLTGLLGPHGLSERLGRELDRAANDGRALTLALLDLGGLAALAGEAGESERCLHAVARALDRACRPGDAVARLARTEGWPIAASVGAASRLRDGATPESLLAAAEARLRSTRPH
jgi:PAS domain S-box-containing protein